MQSQTEHSTAKSSGKRPYRTPELRHYGDVRDLSKGTAAYSNVEGAYQTMTIPMS